MRSPLQVALWCAVLVRVDSRAKQGLQDLKKELGYEETPLLEKLLIQQAALCCLKLNLVELSYSGTMKQSIT